MAHKFEKRTLHISQIQPRTRRNWEAAKAVKGLTDNPLRIVVQLSETVPAHRADFEGDELVPLENDEPREYSIFDGHHRFFKKLTGGAQWVQVVVVKGNEKWDDLVAAGVIREDRVEEAA